MRVNDSFNLFCNFAHLRFPKENKLSFYQLRARIYYDSISKNFFCFKSDGLTLEPSIGYTLSCFFGQDISRHQT